MPPARLEVFYGEALVGRLHDTTPLSFEYAPAWLASPARMAIATIALQPGPSDAPAVQSFFENLLPEGELRRYLAERHKASTLFALLHAVAGDTAGGFVILPEGQAPNPARYTPTTWKALAALLAKQSAAAIDIHGAHVRVSLAGAQDKTSLAIFDDGLPQLPIGASPSTHILKPNIKRLNKVWHSAANEAIVMRAAAACGLPTAEVFYEPLTQACVVRRFDRVARPGDALARLVQYDICQLAGLTSERKYESEGGPGIAQCAALIRQYSTRPAVDLRLFVQWIFFNLYVGNNDSHAKNLALYAAPEGGVTLTPFYDLMCTRLYPGLSPDFAFAIGGETKPGAIGRAHVEAMATTLKMRPAFVLQQARALAERMPAAIDAGVAAIMPALTPAARDLAERLRVFVRTTTKKTAARLNA